MGYNGTYAIPQTIFFPRGVVLILWDWLRAKWNNLCACEIIGGKSVARVAMKGCTGAGQHKKTQNVARTSTRHCVMSTHNQSHNITTRHVTTMEIKQSFGYRPNPSLPTVFILFGFTIFFSAWNLRPRLARKI